MSFKRERIILLVSLIAALILASGALSLLGSAGPILGSVNDQEWDFDGCLDGDGLAHVVYSTQDGLMFADLLGASVGDSRHISFADAEEAAVIWTSDDLFLIAFIVEEDFFDTALKTILYDHAGNNVIEERTIIENASYHGPSMAYLGTTLYMTFEQGGSADGSKAFSSDIAVISSTDDGATWSSPTVLFDSGMDEMDPSLAVFGGKLYMSFVRSQNEEYSQQGNAWEAEDNAVFISVYTASSGWNSPYRVSYDIAEVTDPALVPYGDRLALVWATNVGESGIETTRSISCMLYDGYIWADPIIFKTQYMTDLVPLFIKYTDRLIKDGGTVPSYFEEFSGLELIERDPCITLSDQSWELSSYTTDQVFRKNVTVGNTGNSLLSGDLELPESTDCVVVSASSDEFEVDPDDEMVITLQVELDRAGEYALTVFFRSNDADNRVMPFFINVNIESVEEDFFSNFPDEDLEVLSYGPQGTSIFTIAPITLEFSMPVDVSTFPSAFSINPEVADMSFEWDTGSTSVTITHADLEYNTTYEVTIGTSLLAMDGRALVRTHGWSFTTVSESAGWLLYSASVGVNGNISVNVSAVGLPGLAVFIVIDGIGSFQLIEGDEGKYFVAIDFTEFEPNTTYAYHLSNVSDGPDILPALGGTFTTTPAGPGPDDDDDDDDDIVDDDDTGKDKGLSLCLVISFIVIIVILVLIIIVLVVVRRGSKKADQLNAEMAVFFVMLLVIAAMTPLLGGAQEADTTYLIDEPISDFARSRTNISDPYVVSSRITMMTRAEPLPGEMYSTFMVVTQVFDVGDRIVDGIYFMAENGGTSAASLDVTIRDYDTQRVLVSSRVSIVGPMAEYLIAFENGESIGTVEVEFSTREITATIQPGIIRLGCLAGTDVNVSQVFYYRQINTFTTSAPSGKMVLDNRFNFDTVALGARYLDPQVLVMDVHLDKKAMLLDKEGDAIQGTLTLFNNLGSSIPIRVRVVCYDSMGVEHPIANQFIDLEARNMSDALVFTIGQDLGLREGKHVVVVGLYYQDGLIYRFGDEPFEMYSTAFIVSYRRIVDVAVLPTDRIRPGGHFNVGVLKIDGIDREVDDAGVEAIKGKLRDMAEEYALSYDVVEITDMSGLTALMDGKAEDYAIINTHGSILPLPDMYVDEFAGMKDTKLLLHFNEYKEKPVDSSSYGNNIENYPKSRKPDNTFWIMYEGDQTSSQGEFVPLFVNGLADLPAKPSAQPNYMVSGLSFTLNFKVMDLPPKGSYAQIASFWNRTDLSEAYWSMRLWNSREDNGLVELEVALQDGPIWTSFYYTLPYGKGFDIGEWTALDCVIDRTDPVNTVTIEVFDRFGNTAGFYIGGGAIATPEMDSRAFDSLLLGNNDNNGSVSWKPQPFEAVLLSLAYYLTRGATIVDSDTWDFSVASPTLTITSYWSRGGRIYGSLHSVEDAYKSQFVYSYSFRGGEWLEVVNNEQQKLSQFTIEYLMRIDENPANNEKWTMVSKGYRDNNTGFMLELEGAGTSNIIRFGVGDGEGMNAIEYGDMFEPAISLGAWHKISALCDGSQIVLQIDGQEVAVLPMDKSVVYDSSPIYIGGYGPTDNFKGLMDELIISKGTDNTNHNIKYAEWLTRISTWISSCHCVWVNPVGYPFGYLGTTDTLPIYYGDSLFKQLMAPLTHTPGEFLNPGTGATRTPQGMVLDSEFDSLSLPASIDYDLSCSASREGAVISLYYDTAANRIPAGALKFGEGAYAFSTVFSPDITMALSMIRLPNDYLLNILNSEHYKGEDIIVASHLVNPSDEIETYFVNLTVSDPFGREYVAHSKNVTILPGRTAEEHLLFQPKKSTYPKGTYRLFLSVVRESDSMVLDIWGDDDDESKDLTVNLIDDIELEILDHPKEISHNGTLKVPIRVINHGALPSYVNIEISVLSPSGGIFDVSLEDRLMVASHKSKVVELEWDPAKAVEEQSRKNLVVDLPFGEYKVLAAMYDAESVLYTSSMIDKKAGEGEKWTFLADDMEHLNGAKKESNGWSIEPQRPPVPGYLCKSMNSTELEEGVYTARFDLMIDENTGQDEKVANVSVWFGDTVVSYREIYRNDFINPNSYQFFDVEFSTVGRRNQAMSFRTYWEANCYMKEDRVEVVPYISPGQMENTELRTKPIDFEYTSFSILAETQITAFLMKKDDHYVSAELFYEVGDQKGSFDIPKTDQCYSFTLYHFPKDTIFLSSKGLGGGKDLRLSTVRTTETFIIQKKGSKLIDVEHGYSGDVVDITLTESTSDLMIKDTLTLEDLSINNYTKGVTAGFDDNFSRPYIQFNNSEDWAEFEVDIPDSKVQRLTIEAFEEVGKTIVIKCLINTTKDQLTVTFAFFGGSGTWTQNSTNVELASGHYKIRASQMRDDYHARIYPEIFVTPLAVYDHGESAPPVKEAGNSISICVLGLGFYIDLSFIPKIPNIPIPGIEVPSLSIGDVLKLSVVDVNRTQVDKLVVGEYYYLRFRLEYTHQSKDSKKQVNDTHKSGLKFNYKVANDRPGLESLTFIVGVEMGFVYTEHSSGFRYPTPKSFGLYELGIKIKIRLKAWSNPGIFVLDIVTGGSGSMAPGVSEIFNIVFGALKTIGFDIGAGLYLVIEASLTFKPFFKLIFNIYPIGELWAKIVLDFWFFKFTVIDLTISLVLPIGLTVIIDAGYSPWNVSIIFFIQLGGKLVLFNFKIFNDSIRINLFTIPISKGVPKTRAAELTAG